MLVVLLPPRAFLGSPHAPGALIGTGVVLVFLALLSFLGSRSLELALQVAAAARVELEEANAALETKVAERTLEPAAALERQAAQAHELRLSLDARRRLNETIAELSLPIIPVSEDVLVAPLVENIDSARADQLLASVLAEVERRRARVVVLDVTGVAVVDTHVAGALLRTAGATRLLGAETVLAGIRPEVAQSLVALGADQSRLRTTATLQAVLRTLRQSDAPRPVP